MATISNPNPNPTFPCEVGRTFVFKVKDQEEFDYVMSKDPKSVNFLTDLKEELENGFNIDLIEVDGIKL
jgi:hypothetical protein